MSFKLKTKPKKPIRKNTIEYKEFSYPSVGDILRCLAEVNVHPDDADLSVEGSEYYGYEIQLSYKVIESEEDFEKRMAIYQEKLSMYKQWEKENAEAIAVEKAERQRKADEKKALQEEYKRKLKELENK